MTKHEAARLVVSRDPESVTLGAEMCAGINCDRCFKCHFETTRYNLSERNAARWLYHTAAAWLASHPEEPTK